MAKSAVVCPAVGRLSEMGVRFFFPPHGRGFFITARTSRSELFLLREGSSLFLSHSRRLTLPPGDRGSDPLLFFLEIDEASLKPQPLLSKVASSVKASFFQQTATLSADRAVFFSFRRARTGAPWLNGFSLGVEFFPGAATESSFSLGGHDRVEREFCMPSSGGCLFFSPDEERFNVTAGLFFFLCSGGALVYDAHRL